MGIKGLHKALSFCTIKDNLRNYRNAIIAVDTSSWMHRSVYSIAEKFVEATNANILDEGCVSVSARYLIGRCKELIESYGIRAVYLVMDGKRIPLKADESHDRDQKRQQNLSEARRLKKAGERWKAEDKYKTCIRIKDEFTRAVMKEVKKAFSHYGRVHCVNSPHEADSQLTRLVLDGVADAVITEDSDVLVYSAAAHVAFPILFKLDRKTGDCDSIKMDWLLSLSSEEASKPVVSNNTLEVILRRFAARQAKRRGFGVRLFVQGCILSGCDYRKNIEGIGITNAFKLVRDNAFRNDSVRFRKILESLPKKVKQNIDINEYEEILSKSEAIFFYHPVLHTCGNIKPLLEPRLSPGECGDEHHFTDHYPFMSRFEGDWSFLGKMSSETNRDDKHLGNESIENQQSVAVEPAKPQKKISSDQTRKRDWSRLLSSARSKGVIRNPYKKSKPCDSKVILPLEERNINTRINLEKKISTKAQPKSQAAGSITRFLVKPDPRYARRSLSSTPTGSINQKRSNHFSLSRAASKFNISSRSSVSKKSPGQSFFLPRSKTKQNSTSSAKCSGVESTRVGHEPKRYTPIEETNAFHKFIYEDGDGFEKSDRHDFYDLTDSNSCASNEANDATANGSKESHDATEEERAICTVPPTVASPVMGGFNKCSESMDKPFCADQLHETEQKEIMTSKYFRKRNGSRRVTLDKPIAFQNF